MVQLRAGRGRRHARRAALQLRAEGGGSFRGFGVVLRAQGLRGLGVFVFVAVVFFRWVGFGVLGLFWVRGATWV